MCHASVVRVELESSVMGRATPARTWMDHATPPGGGAREARQPPGYQRGEAQGLASGRPPGGGGRIWRCSVCVRQGLPEGVARACAPSTGRYVVAWGLQRFSGWFPRRAWVNPARRTGIVGDGSCVGCARQIGIVGDGSFDATCWNQTGKDGCGSIISCIASQSGYLASWR